MFPVNGKCPLFGTDGLLVQTHHAGNIFASVKVTIDWRVHPIVHIKDALA